MKYPIRISKRIAVVFVTVKLGLLIFRYSVLSFDSP
jgi:hypothetical protein